MNESNNKQPPQEDFVISHPFNSNHEEKLERSLSNRHIQLIAIGGAIGTGLFMGSGKTLSVSGTSVILTYMIIGFFFFFVMRAMGELLLSNLKYKSFTDFCTAYLGPWAGFFLGWSYWLSWVVAAIADMIVIGGYMQYWDPTLSPWIPAFATIFVLTVLNSLTVKLFGEMEFWFALLKIIAIVLFLGVSLYLIFTHFVSPNGTAASFSHLLDEKAMLPFGLSGFFAGFQIAIFSFIGIELVGTTAAETKDPHKSLPKAINSIPIRIMLFYVAALICVVSVTSWSQISTDQSPFVQFFTLIGIPAAASLMNFVVATSAISSANSGIFATSRMLYGLAVEKDADNKFAKLTKRKVPMNSLLFSMLLVVLGTSILFIVPNVMTAFTIISTFGSILVIFTFGLILAAYLSYRRKDPVLHEQSTYKMPLGIFMSWATLAFLVFSLIILALDKQTFIALAISPLWFLALYFFYSRRRKKFQAGL
ncbi:amino acid transporter (plasmid) [Acinetobacter sp. NCu2D-2]|uniref:amino acid permease n=1 Tax=Acinetobacter sp. NCu2D-2 TaxID=1608473 RepID=UPI0007CDFFDD|nr:amino acid permease [Acinetobacter sp. NCu2D-2]ANF83263.1 amino acid transporter [Acinetobacter sp. NCu2D-2]